MNPLDFPSSGQLIPFYYEQNALHHNLRRAIQRKTHCIVTQISGDDHSVTVLHVCLLLFQYLLGINTATQCRIVEVVALYLVLYGLCGVYGVLTQYWSYSAKGIYLEVYSIRGTAAVWITFWYE